MFASEEYVKHPGVLIDKNLSWKYCILMNEKILSNTVALNAIWSHLKSLVTFLNVC